MPHSSVVGMYVYCRQCQNKQRLGPLNARKVDTPDPFDVGWLVRCDRCCKEDVYQRKDFVTD